MKLFIQNIVLLVFLRITKLHFCCGHFILEAQTVCLMQTGEKGYKWLQGIVHVRCRHIHFLSCAFLFFQSQPIKYMNQLVTREARISREIKAMKWVKRTNKEMLQEITLVLENFFPSFHERMVKIAI